MLVAQYFVAIALKNNSYKEVHHDKGHEQLEDGEKYPTNRCSTSEETISLNILITLILFTSEDNCLLSREIRHQVCKIFAGARSKHT